MNRKGIPQGLKPGDLLALDGTAEAVPPGFCRVSLPNGL